MIYITFVESQLDNVFHSEKETSNDIKSGEAVEGKGSEKIRLNEIVFHNELQRK